ncbi:hypothetical protein MCHI_002629 [Candidatus Magnetoovum chiemensis]|nr:hypothetical protein MCHI_002629 [Candidatus Magnetoovum chiemensis]
MNDNKKKRITLLPTSTLEWILFALMIIVLLALIYPIVYHLRFANKELRAACKDVVGMDLNSVKTLVSQRGFSIFDEHYDYYINDPSMRGDECRVTVWGDDKIDYSTCTGVLKEGMDISDISTYLKQKNVTLKKKRGQIVFINPKNEDHRCYGTIKDRRITEAKVVALL